jgi:NDP-sugar pyrophosphorylase family protein
MPPVAILAGGLATRMRPLTDVIPKALLEVAGRPFIAHQLHFLATQGVSRVVLCLGYLGEQVQNFVGDGSRYGLNVSYCFDGDSLRGTGGALKRAQPYLHSAFFVMYGDSYLDVPMQSVWHRYQISKQPALMTIFKNEGRWDTSNVVYDGNRIIQYNKHQRHPDMQFIDFGLGILSPKIFDAWPEGQAFDLADVYSDLANLGALAAWESQSRFYEIGTPSGLADTERFLQGHLSRESVLAVP